MPFRSKAQKRWMYANKPGMAKRWQAETPSDEALPEHAPGKVKKAEPPPPKGVSMKEWDRILQKGPGKIKKAESFSPSYVSGGFPNAAGPEDWDSVGDSPWKQGEPKAKPEEEPKKKVKSSDFDDSMLSGDPTRLMPALRSIHKMGHVKRAAGEAMFDPGAEAEAETEQELSALPPGTGGPHLSAAEAKALFVDLPKHRLQEVQRGLMEDALMRKALGKIGHVKQAAEFTQRQIDAAQKRFGGPEGLGYEDPGFHHAYHKDPEVRMMVARSPHLNADLHDDLLRDSDPRVRQIMRERLGHAKTAQDVGTLYDIGSMGPSERESSNVTFKMPKLKRAAGLDQEYPQVEDGEKGYEDAPVTLQAARQSPWKRSKVASIVHLPRESYEAFLDELGRLRQLMEEG